MSQEAIESNAIVTRLAGVKTLPSSLHETLMMTWQPHQGQRLESPLSEDNDETEMYICF